LTQVTFGLGNTSTGFYSRPNIEMEHSKTNVPSSASGLRRVQTSKTGFTGSTYRDTRAKLIADEESKERRNKGMFVTTFHLESNEDMRKKESKLEQEHRVYKGASNKYCPPSNHKFRADEQPYWKKPFLVTR
jgi:hypothetical protein